MKRNMKGVGLVVIGVLCLAGCGGSNSPEEEEQVIVEDIDTDSDGVIDTKDQCEGTGEAYTSYVDENGCVAGEFNSYVYAINSGGTAYTSKSGVQYQGDVHYVGGEISSSSSTISETEDDALYQTERWGEFYYALPIVEGTYSIKLHLAEIYHTDAGKRVMDIEVESQVVESSLDIYSEVGGNNAYAIELSDISIVDGELNIRFIKQTDNAKVAAIDVFKVINRAEDEDQDGVLNYLDECVYTDSNLAGDVLENGCALAETDADNDGLIDNIDQCLGTGATSIVDLNGCSARQLDSDNDGIVDAEDRCAYTPGTDIGGVNSLGCTDNEYGAGTYVESDGVVVVEVEHLDFSNVWRLREGKFAANDGFLEWNGADSFNTPGSGVITVNIAINNPGTYRFLWRNLIGAGSDPTEHNDSWLQIAADNFYAERDGHIVCPREQLSSNQCVGGGPAGSSSGGWLKVYRSGGPTDAWKWSGYSSDNDAHAIYADFDNVGEYQLKISGRSKHHAIDRFVLYRANNAADNIGLSFATDLARRESTRQ